MNSVAIAIRCSAVLCGAVLHTLPLATAAVDFAAMPAARLTVLPDRYVLDGREYYDVSAVDAALRKTSIQAVRIDNCASAWTPRSMSTIVKLHVYALDLRLLDPETATCKMPPLSPERLASAASESGLAAEEIARYWRNLEP